MSADTVLTVQQLREVLLGAVCNLCESIAMACEGCAPAPEAKASEIPTDCVHERAICEDIGPMARNCIVAGA